MAETSSSSPKTLPSPNPNDPASTIQPQQQQLQTSNLQNNNNLHALSQIASSQPQLQQQTTSQQQVSSPSMISSPQQQLQQIQQQQSSIASLPNYQIQQTLQRSPSMSRLNHMNQQQLNQYKQQHQQGLYGNFTAVAGSISQNLAQSNQHLPQQLVSNSTANLSRSAMLGQNGQLPMLSGPTQFNLASHMLPSARQRPGMIQGSQTGVIQGSQLHPGNSAGQSLQGLQAMGMMGSLNPNSQLRSNGSLAYASAQQRINPAQLRQLAQQSPLTSTQVQNMSRPSSLAFMNPQFSGLAQNAPTALLQNTLSQQQWLKSMPAMSGPASPTFRLQHQRPSQALLHQQLASNSQLLQNPSALSSQLSQLAQQQSALGHQPLQHQQQQTQQQQQSQQLLQHAQHSSQQFQQQHPLHQHMQQSPQIPLQGGQKSVSLTGSQPDATASGATTPGGSSSQGTEATNQILGKRKIQDLVSQVDSNATLDPDVEDLLLEFADGFIDSVTTFACSLAKHRKSSTLDSQDLLLHLERNWKLPVLGYSTADQKKQKQISHGDLHKRRLEMIRSLLDPSRAEISNSPATDILPQANQMSATHFIKPSPSSDHLISQSTNSQLLGQTTRY